MDEAKLRKIIQNIRQGKISDEDALDLFKNLPYQDLGYAKIDHHRTIRKGFPEVIFGQGKTPRQILEIAREIHSQHSRVLITRVSSETYAVLKDQLPEHHYYALGRAIRVGEPLSPESKFPVPVVTGGTADLPVAEEAVATLELMGSKVKKVYDAGVSGIHRILDSRHEFESSRVIIVVAGMDGVLPSIVGGLVRQPVIAVPTSSGYGANFNGIAPLLTMINSCAPGVVVVNIDNGFGAGFAASLINRL